MPDLIDSTTGNRIDNDTGKNKNTQAELGKAFWNAIEDTKGKIADRGGDIPENARYVVVERGDCLWNIAEEYGVDPQTLIKDNKQFMENPDLIHAGQIVVVRIPDAANNPGGSGKATAESMNGRTSAAKGMASYPQEATINNIKSDIGGYVDSLEPLSDAAREEAIGSFLQSASPDVRRMFFQVEFERGGGATENKYHELNGKYGANADYKSALDEAYRFETGKDQPPQDPPRFDFPQAPR